MSRKITQRLFIVMLAIIMTISSIPSSLLVFADDYSGGGEGGTSVSDISDPKYSCNGDGYGIRIYCIERKCGNTSHTHTKDCYKIKTGNNGATADNYAIDLWYNLYSIPTSKYNTTCRYGSISLSNTYINTFVDGVTVANERLINSGRFNAGTAILPIPEFAGYNGSSTFKMDGESFKENWATKDVKTASGNNIWDIVALYYGITSITISDSDFLVIEPIMYLPLIKGICGNYTSYGDYACTWYGFVNLLGEGNPGATMKLIKKAWGNGFELTTGMAGLTAPTSDFGADQYIGSVGTNGWGLHILKSDPFGGNSTPIDTYDIINQTKNSPTPPEAPSEGDGYNTKGEKTIIKLYADLYKDPNTGYYTQIVNVKESVMEGVSNHVTITNEKNINGYQTAAWYMSNKKYSSASSEDKKALKASNMIKTRNVDVTDGTINLKKLGGKQIRVEGYQTAFVGTNGFAFESGGNRYFTGLASPHGETGTGFSASASPTSMTQHTTYKRLAANGDGKSYYGTYKYTENKEGTTVDFNDAETLVVLYTREMSHIKTTDSSVKTDNNKTKDNSGNLTIVKLYGTINPSTYEIEDITSKVLEGTTRNVNIKNEANYNFAEWIYVTGGASTSLKASDMGNPHLSTYKFDDTADQAYRLDGFVDGFKNNTRLEQYFRFSGTLPKIYPITGSSGLTSSETPGRYSYGSRSGIGTKSYNSTIYFGGGGSLKDSVADSSDTNDVLYLLFLKTEELSYAADDLVIPESYLTRYDNYKHNPMTVTGSVNGTVYSEYNEYLQAHKFKYLLPVITTDKNKVVSYKDVNPLFIPHIKSRQGFIFCLFQKIN